MECYCDYEPADVYDVKTHVARKPHRCYECHRTIQPGETYERTSSLYDGLWTISPTCTHCLALRNYITAHVPCVCWLHGSMIDDCLAAAEQYSREAPGLWFGALRRQVMIRRAANPAAPR